ncbi:YggS family pyridoxal phosphate-dependent enzyme [Neosynechococcus sphagnicola]|uniref:YggS family pyridoxal phosphate-dependent enzyme n=1 Tax=Neosynechococcus sphagnicola TaxID=1501145 RepID=UPI000A7E1C73
MLLPPSAILAERIAQIQQTLPPSVRLIAVTKQVESAVIRAAYVAGLRDFGENRVQEAIAKQLQLQDCPGITWHLIGHLQSNKVQKALGHFQWIHSVDSLKLADQLNHLATDLSQPPCICLQVKILPDPNKYGWTVPQLLADLATLNQYTHLDICGLMTIPTPLV